MDDADSWTHRTVWTEKKGDRVVVRVVGRAGHVSLDESMAYDNAEQDAREKLAIYLGGVVDAFREKLAATKTIGSEDADGDAVGSGEVTKSNLSGGRTLATAATRGLEVVTSKRDKDTNTLLVLGELDTANVKALLAQSEGLRDAERARIAENSAEVRAAWDEALKDGARRAQE